MSHLRRLIRLPLLLLHLMVAVLITLLFGRQTPEGLPGPRFRRLIRAWYRGLCRILGVRVHVLGHPVEGPALMVANHVSWLDIPVIGAHAPVGFLSKSEVRRWPVIGWMARFTATVFIRRGEHGAADEVTRALAGQMERGGAVVVFPEGTTTDGTRVRRFHPRLFAAAQQAGCPVQPVALRYHPRPDGQPGVAPFVGGESFLSHALRLLGEPGLGVDVVFAPPLAPEDLDRRGLAREAQAAVARVVSGGG
ncbi:MAG: lysophospholipid acyltransferase family protein [Ectothiorhodospira sp.]